MDKGIFLPIIGATEYVEIFGVSNIPAKIDTGADSSAIWTSNVKMQRDGVLEFCLFDKSLPFYTGEIIKTTDYVAKSVKSSNGETEVRYRVKMPLVLGGKKFLSSFTLADRSLNKFPVLIGRRSLEGKFLVDVTKSEVMRGKLHKSNKLNVELKADPYEFHQKYMEKGVKK